MTDRTINTDNFEYIIDKIFNRFNDEFTEAIEAYEEKETYISQTHFGDYLLFENNYIKLYAIHEENNTGYDYELEYKFEPFGSWQSIVTFNV